jgi:tetratricopeptide (TPR) repeat protein
MKKIAKLFAATLFALSVCVAANAQDLAQAGELYNNAATALNGGDKAGALEGFKKALDMATALGEEGAALATDCKNIIPNILLSLGKDAANAKDMAKAVEFLAQAQKLGAEYGQQEIADEAKTLVPQLYIAEANSLLNEKKFAEAAAEYQKALDLDGTNGVAWLRLGMCKSNSADTEGALAAFAKASEFGQKAAADKQIGTIYLKAAVAAYKAKNHAATLENVLKSNEYGVKTANLYGGMAAFNLKKYDQAISLLEGEGSTNSNYYLARAYEAKGTTQKLASTTNLSLQTKTLALTLPAK